MCNLYSETSNAQAIIDLVKAFNRAGNLPALPGIFPDKMAPVVRASPTDGARELTMLRWGMPSPPEYLEPGAVDPGVTNIRNAWSPHWRPWIGPANRCVVPATSFCEPTTDPDPATGKKVWTWFALNEDRPLFFFAGPIEIAIQRAKNVRLISERAKTIMKDAVFQGGRPDICIIKDQMGHVLGEVSELALTLTPSSLLHPG